MTSATLFEDELAPQAKVVNVASVPHRSPFRYPGGKTWLIPTIRKWLGTKRIKVNRLVEPFAGGGIVSLTSAAEGLTNKVVMVELDSDIAAVWNTVIYGQGYLLAKRIVEFELNAETVSELIGTNHVSEFDRAFATLVRNRVSRGGILAPGAGLVKNGENGKGLASRWYPQTLSKRIIDIQEYRNVITFLKKDGFQVMEQYRNAVDSAFFIDPPYVVAGRRLYVHAAMDHEKLFEVASKLRGDFLMTYDDAAEIRKLASRYGFETRLIPMKNTHHECKHELLISSDLSWLDGGT